MRELWLALVAVQAEPADAPYGWMCRVEAGLGAGAGVELTQSVDHPGGGYLVQVEVYAGRTGFGTPAQSLRWHQGTGPEGLAQPSNLIVEIPLAKRDRKGSIRIEHDGGTTVMATAYRNLHRPVRGRASLLVQDPEALRGLWASGRWRVSVLDRRGSVRGAVDGALPPRSSAEQALRRLLPELKAKVDDPARHCDELGVDATI